MSGLIDDSLWQQRSWEPAASRLCRDYFAVGLLGVHGLTAYAVRSRSVRRYSSAQSGKQSRRRGCLKAL
jgi:hypothetical protein